MSDTGRGNGGEVFGGAAQASQYIEEDTVVKAPPVQVVEVIEIPADLDTKAAAAPDSGVVVSVAEQPNARTSHDAASFLFGGPAVETAAAVNENATVGFRGALAKMGFRVKPGVEEAEARRKEAVKAAAESVVRQATWTRAVGILVANPKGGTGKSPTSLALGGSLSWIRGGSTAILEVSDDPGALGLRAEGNPTLGLGELVRDIKQITNAGMLNGYTAPQTSYAAVIGSIGRRENLTGEDVVAVSQVIDEFYGIRLMDSGNVITSSAFRGAVSVTDVLVIPVMNAGDSVIDAMRLLEDLRAAGGKPKQLADNAIVVRITDGRPENATVKAEVERLLHEAGVASLHEIPYDAHIAERGQITLDKLNPATREAFATLAADVVTTLKTLVSTDR
jgi:MinD-like ATPase involved in chromosome partitioning or flagellar assembly